LEKYTEYTIILHVNTLAFHQNTAFALPIVNRTCGVQTDRYCGQAFVARNRGVECGWLAEDAQALRREHQHCEAYCSQISHILCTLNSWVRPRHACLPSLVLDRIGLLEINRRHPYEAKLPVKRNVVLVHLT